MMQPASDIFLGWSEGPKRRFFVRQLRDIKTCDLDDALSKLAEKDPRRAVVIELRFLAG